MRTWFPFSDYDFYTYLSSGILILFALDYLMTGGSAGFEKSWTTQQIILGLIVAYVMGQIITIPASILYETILLNKIFGHPMEVQLGYSSSKFRTFISLFLGKDYRFLPESVRKNVIERAKNETNLTEAVLMKDKLNIFDVAFVGARGREEDKIRIDDFRNQYGFNRNMSFASFLTAFFIYRSSSVNSSSLSLVFIFLGLGMMIRFLTSYTSFSAEIFRSYAFDLNNKNSEK